MADYEYSFTSPRRQLLALPPTIIYSMLENPSSHKGLSKLYQTCKYFYGKRPILIAEIAQFTMQKDEHGKHNAGILLEYRRRSHFLLARLQIPIWPTKYAGVNYINANDRFRLPLCYRCSAETVVVINGNLIFEDFVLLTSEKTVQRFMADLKNCVYHQNEKNDLSMTATIDKILQHLPNLLYFEYFIDQRCTAEILTKMNDVKLKNKLSKLVLYFYDVHSTFDFNLFCEFVMQNSNADTKIHIQTLKDAAERKLQEVLPKVDPKWYKEGHRELRYFLYEVKNYGPWL